MLPIGTKPMFVHACAGNPVPFSKVQGQVLPVENFIEQAAFTRACVRVLDAEPGLGHTALSRTFPSNSKPVSRVDSDT